MMIPPSTVVLIGEKPSLNELAALISVDPDSLLQRTEALTQFELEYFRPSVVVVASNGNGKNAVTAVRTVRQAMADVQIVAVAGSADEVKHLVAAGATTVVDPSATPGDPLHAAAMQVSALLERL